MDETKNEILEISGSISRVTFYNSGTGFTVLELQLAGGVVGDTVTVVGSMADVSPGEELNIMGHYDFHNTYGPQFKASHVERAMPSTAAAVLRYLSSGAIKGIGPATARRLVDRFGAKTLEIMEAEPARLREVRGISPDKAKKISEELARQSGVREVMLFLSEYEISPDDSLKVFKALGPAAVDLVRSNPYLLCMDEIRISFERADVIARSLNIPADDPARLSAGLEFVLRHNLGNGHTCIPKAKLLSVAKGLLDCDGYNIDDLCYQMVDRGRLFAKSVGSEEYFFLPLAYRAENYCAGRLAMMLSHPPLKLPSGADEVNRAINNAEFKLGIHYAELQKDAIRASFEKGLLILTGGPGTGKTTTLNAIIQLLEQKELDIALAAPTGRAAKRMSELTGGREAKTLHRLLEVEWSDTSETGFSRNEQNPLECDVLIVDELSMVDVFLFEALLRALPLGCRLILVGDSDQLSSVGAGNVLHDLLEADVLPSIRLTEVFRQAMESLIVTNAHAIVAGEAPELSIKSGDFFMLEQSSQAAAAKMVTDLLVRRLPEAYQYDPLSDIQILCPSRMLTLGTVSLNNMLQQSLNPLSDEKREMAFKSFTLRTGDRVMQTKNNYDIIWSKADGTGGSGAFNGDVGILESLDVRSGTVTVRFDDRLALYSGDDVHQLELAYAMTIHKSQGSEFPCVILPILDVPGKLRYRNLLYTAVTRARERLIIVGSKSVVCAMAQNNRKTMRYTLLSKMLEASVN